MPEAKTYHCPGCGMDVVIKATWRGHPSCPKCGLMLREGIPPKKRIAIVAIAAAFALMLAIVVYLALK